jgi:dipeptide/tripeptide permease
VPIFRCEGDQFKLPEQALQLETFFTVFYFSINCGSLLSTIITPILREVPLAFLHRTSGTHTKFFQAYLSSNLVVQEKCFGEDSCFSLAFGIPALLMAAATVVIIAGFHKSVTVFFVHTGRTLSFTYTVKKGSRVSRLQQGCH